MYGNQGEVEMIDGLSVAFDDWHFNIRMSNTEPLLRLNLEASTKELTIEKINQLMEIIQN